MAEKYSDFAGAAMNAQTDTFPEGERAFCEAGAKAIAEQTAQDAYDQENPQFWFWALHQLNPDKCKAITATMMERLVDEGADVPEGTDPVKDPKGYMEWYAANEAGRHANANTCHSAFEDGARLMEDDVEGLDAKGRAFLQMNFVVVWRSAMRELTGEGSGHWQDHLSSQGGKWFQSQCTFEEFCNGKVAG